jgi:5,5'-dehydrodivanillate O-demethylase
MPIAAVADFEDSSIMPVRLMGEDLVLYKDLQGRFGLLSRRCAHRGADLSYGFVEECGLRCSYHGWLYDGHGKCIEQPYEDVVFAERNLKGRMGIPAYRVEQKGGLLWAYLGPQPAPLVPDWEFFHWKNGFIQIVYADVPCNWLQCQENSIDPVHFEWMHANRSIRLSGGARPYASKHILLDFNEFEYGFQYKRITEGTDDSHPLWTVGRVCLWPNALFTGDHIEYRVPVDDENTLSVTWSYTRVPKDREPFVQQSIPAWKGPIKDEKTGRWIDTHVMNQDFVAWLGQGSIADRTRESLSHSDQGIMMLRRRLFSDIDLVTQGRDPKATIRDPAFNDRLVLPIADRSFLESGVRATGAPQARPVTLGYVLQAGQPAHVTKAFEEAMGGTVASIGPRVMPAIDVL